MPSHFYLALFPRVTTDIHLKDSAKKRSPRKGYDHFREENRKTLLTKEQVLEARWLNEFGGWTYEHIAAHYRLSKSYTNNLLTYAARGKIVPTRDLFPSGHRPAPISSSSSPKD